MLAKDTRIERGLRPLELGRSASGQPLGWDERIADWKARRDPVPASGESLAQLGQRVMDVVTSLRKEYAGGSVVFVAHNEVIGAFLGLVRGAPGAASYTARVGNGSISVVEAGPGGPPVLVFADHTPPEAPSPAP